MADIGPVAAGKFYPAERSNLIGRLEECYTHSYGPGQVPARPEGELEESVGIIAPHAGYRASGPVAACSYHWLGGLGAPRSVIIIGTNHTGLGSRVSVLTEGTWETPLGTLDIDTELANSLVEESEVLTPGTSAFTREHSIETQLPFLQHLLEEDFAFVPICPRDQSRETAIEIARAVVEVSPQGTLLVGSTDFTHYEPQEEAERKDSEAINAILDLNLDLFYDRVKELNISICGYGAVGSLINFARKKGLTAEELKYATSGEITGMGREVVGYSAIGFEG